MRLRLRSPLSFERPPAAPAPEPPTPVPPAYTPPPGLDFVYQASVDALASQDKTISSLDARAGVLLGATAAAFGLIASNGGTSASLFTQHRPLAILALFTLALALCCLIAVVLVRNVIEFPGVPALIRLANEPAGRIKELSLDGLQQAWQRNRRLIVWKARFLLTGQVIIVLFVLLVTAFALPELGRLLAAAWDAIVRAIHGYTVR
jgi:hypothetical protein